jgi:hypothetical protein
VGQGEAHDEARSRVHQTLEEVWGAIEHPPFLRDGHRGRRPLLFTSLRSEQIPADVGQPDRATNVAASVDMPLPAQPMTTIRSASNHG